MKFSVFSSLGVAVMLPIARAFVPIAGLSTTNGSPRDGASAPSSNHPSIPTGVTTHPMKAGQGSYEDARDDSAISPEDGARSRACFVEHAASSATTFAVGAWGVGLSPATADSTGKYSTKATARKRYLPRIVKLVSAFHRLKKEIAEGSATPTSTFFVDILPDGIPAMDLFGSSMKRGEYPDSTSRGLQQLAQDFGTTCKAIGKSLGKGGNAEDAARAYEEASVILADYLKGTKLDPMGSDNYM